MPYQNVTPPAGAKITAAGGKIEDESGASLGIEGGAGDRLSVVADFDRA